MVLMGGKREIVGSDNRWQSKVSLESTLTNYANYIRLLENEVRKEIAINREKNGSTDQYEVQSVNELSHQ